MRCRDIPIAPRTVSMGICGHEGRLAFDEDKIRAITVKTSHLTKYRDVLSFDASEKCDRQNFETPMPVTAGDIKYMYKHKKMAIPFSDPRRLFHAGNVQRSAESPSPVF